MKVLSDTIVAPMTALGGAVAVIRLSGFDAWRIGRAVFPGLPEPMAPRHAYHGTYVNGDDGLAVFFAEGKSFTGEESCELSVHGSRASVESLVSACVAHGARLAEPGEFTRRAWLQGRLDLTQSEGVLESVQAKTRLQLENANGLRSGVLARAIQGMRADLLDALAQIEAHVDFSEELGDLQTGPLVELLRGVWNRCAEHLERSRLAKDLRDGTMIAIVGEPNAGKSSLLNALAGSDRAIVTPIAGTTRDTIEVEMELEGHLVRLIDTAGIRETSDTVERIGVERAKEAATNAALCLLLFDSSVGWTKANQQLLDEIGEVTEVWPIANKTDLAPAEFGFSISCQTGAGLTELMTKMGRQVMSKPAVSEGVLNARHIPLFARALESISFAVDALLDDAVPDDLAATHVRLALESLGDVTGETASADMVDEIFSRFCLGK